MVQVKGDRLNVTVNGKKTLDNEKVLGTVPKGGIVLQPDNEVAQFRNLFIRELSKKE